jgi:hypothetical protein
MPRLSRRPALLLLPLALAACASPPGAGPDPNAAPRLSNVAQNQVLDGAGMMQADVMANRTVRAEALGVEASPDRAYAALSVAFEKHGLPASHIVTPLRELGVSDLKARRRLGNERLSRYLNCGDRLPGMPNADDYDVRLSVQSRVVAVPGDSVRSSLVTLVTGSARPIGLGGGQVSCTTTGELERRLAASVNTFVGAPPQR